MTFPFQLFECHLLLPIDVKMTKLGFLRLSYEKQDTLLKLLILSMAAVLCECACGPRFLWGWKGENLEKKKSGMAFLNAWFFSVDCDVFFLLLSISIIF